MEDIDNETLQAQIDLSLSYAQNLVSSWVKPSPKPTKNSSQALEAELKEYMRRPPRLGVGAPIPETAASSSRDTERLKSHLSGKRAKRTRGDDDNELDSTQLSDAEDSRGASIKKKARIDPFEVSHKKKKAKEALKPALVPHQKIAVKEIPTEDAGESKHVTAQGSSSPIPGSLNDTSFSKNSKDPLATEAIDISILVNSAPASPVSPARDHLSAQNSPLLKGPILNLTGPSSDDESGEEGEPGEPTTTSPKKRRRKRKKKKSLLGVQPGL
ncbi:hypothetical protein B0H12DRAFT_1237366 [Mycena haematopus]|nr:hypothetical protein B0H12DRAFT_1237366 [Mycena haematopus]